MSQLIVPYFEFSRGQSYKEMLLNIFALTVRKSVEKRKPTLEVTRPTQILKNIIRGRQSDTLGNNLK